jgi:hypothetical protein
MDEASKRAGFAYKQHRTSLLLGIENEEHMIKDKIGEKVFSVFFESLSDSSFVSKSVFFGIDLSGL